MSGEFELIDWIRRQQTATPAVPLPAGDDLAVLRWPGDDLLLVGVDQVLDGVHFRVGEHSPEQIGRKAMNRNLSDCAAMACLPVAAVCTVALPKGTPPDYPRRLYMGMRDAGAVFACAIVGGDTASWAGPLALTLTILGTSAGIEPITRRGARPGEAIYVTGPLGGSILGRHLDFVPRIREAREIAQAVRVSAMLDLSDGLSRDLRHIADQGGVAAVVDADRVPIHPDAQALAQRDGKPALEHALHDGEDHELLFTAPAQAAEALRNLARPIGTIEPGAGVFLRRTDGSRAALPAGGWQHEF